MTTFLKIVILVLLSLSSAAAADGLLGDGTAALVNGAAITTVDLRGELARILRLKNKTDHDLDPSALALMKKKALEGLVSRELLYQESMRVGIRIQDAAVDAELSKLRKLFPSEEDFNVSLGKLNLTGDSAQSRIKRGMAIQALIDSRFSAEMAVTMMDARSYYDSHRETYIHPEQVRLSHILVKHGSQVGRSGTTPARTIIEDIHRRISQGADFSLLARESDDSATRMTGGDLGWFSPGQLGKHLEKAAFSLADGQISTIVEDGFGYHILKVTERRPEAVLPFDDVREEIISRLQRERMLGVATPYLERLRKSARVEILLAGDE